MQQRDLIKAQIEQLGRALGKLITLVLGMDNGGDVLGVTEEVVATFDKELQLDFKKLIGLSQAEFQQTIKEKFQDQEEPLEQLATLLFEMGSSCGPEGALRQQYLEKALWILEYINLISPIFSMKRITTINTIKKMANTEEQQFIYHFVRPDYWQQQAEQALYFPSDYKTEGFIHCCTRGQWEHVRTNYYKGVPIIKVLKLDPQQLTSEVKYEGKKAEKFPHIYGGINKEAIVEIVEIRQDKHLSKKLIEQKIQILAAAPDLLEELIAEIPKGVLKARRIKGKWSIHEHACHLAEAQRMIIGRFKRFQQEKNPTFVPYLPGTTVPDDNLAKMDLQEQLADFRANRQVMIDLLKSYTEEDWGNEGNHPEYIRINPLLWLRHVMMHDHFHFYRIEELWLTTDEYLRQPT